jgi:hypothetical protein
MVDKNFQHSRSGRGLYTYAEQVGDESIDAFIRLEAVQTVKAGDML